MAMYSTYSPLNDSPGHQYPPILANASDAMHLLDVWNACDFFLFQAFFTKACWDNQRPGFFQPSRAQESLQYVSLKCEYVAGHFEDTFALVQVVLRTTCLRDGLGRLYDMMDAPTREPRKGEKMVGNFYTLHEFDSNSGLVSSLQLVRVAETGIPKLPTHGIGGLFDSMKAIAQRLEDDTANNSELEWIHEYLSEQNTFSMKDDDTRLVDDSTIADAFKKQGYL